MNRVPQNRCRDYYLYADDLESMIKTCIWILSAIGGIWTQQFTEDRVRGGAFFILALSLMMEFAPKIKEKSVIAARIIHILFLIVIVLMFSFSFALLFGAKVSSGFIICLNVFLGVIIAFISLNCIACCIGIVELLEKDEMSKEFIEGSGLDAQALATFMEKAQFPSEVK